MEEARVKRGEVRAHSLARQLAGVKNSYLVQGTVNYIFVISRIPQRVIGQPTTKINDHLNENLFSLNRIRLIEAQEL